MVREIFVAHSPLSVAMTMLMWKAASWKWEQMLPLINESINEKKEQIGTDFWEGKKKTFARSSRRRETK